MGLFDDKLWTVESPRKKAPLLKNMLGGKRSHTDSIANLFQSATSQGTSSKIESRKASKKRRPTTFHVYGLTQREDDLDFLDLVGRSKRSRQLEKMERATKSEDDASSAAQLCARIPLKQIDVNVQSKNGNHINVSKDENHKLGSGVVNVKNSNHKLGSGVDVNEQGNKLSSGVDDVQSVHGNQIVTGVVNVKSRNGNQRVGSGVDNVQSGNGNQLSSGVDINESKNANHKLGFGVDVNENGNKLGSGVVNVQSGNANQLGSGVDVNVKNRNHKLGSGVDVEVNENTNNKLTSGVNVQSKNTNHNLGSGPGGMLDLRKLLSSQSSSGSQNDPAERPLSTGTICFDDSSSRSERAEVYHEEAVDCNAEPAGCNKSEPVSCIRAETADKIAEPVDCNAKSAGSSLTDPICLDLAEPVDSNQSEPVCRKQSAPSATKIIQAVPAPLRQKTELNECGGGSSRNNLLRSHTEPATLPHQPTNKISICNLIHDSPNHDEDEEDAVANSEAEPELLISSFSPIPTPFQSRNPTWEIAEDVTLDTSMVHDHDNVKHASQIIEAPRSQRVNSGGPQEQLDPSQSRESQALQDSQLPAGCYTQDVMFDSQLGNEEVMVHSSQSHYIESFAEASFGYNETADYHNSDGTDAVIGNRNESEGGDAVRYETEDVSNKETFADSHTPKSQLAELTAVKVDVERESSSNPASAKTSSTPAQSIDEKISQDRTEIVDVDTQSELSDNEEIATSVHIESANFKSPEEAPEILDDPVEPGDKISNRASDDGEQASIQAMPHIRQNKRNISLQEICQKTNSARLPARVGLSRRHKVESLHSYLPKKG